MFFHSYVSLPEGNHQQWRKIKNYAGEEVGFYLFGDSCFFCGRYPNEIRTLATWGFSLWYFRQNKQSLDRKSPGSDVPLILKRQTLLMISWENVQSPNNRSFGWVFLKYYIYIYLTILNRPTKQTSLRTDVEMLTSWFNKKIPPIWRRSADGVISKKHVDFAEIQVEYKMKSKGKHQPWIFIKVFMEFHYTMMINNPSNITWWYWILTWILRP